MDDPNTRTSKLIANLIVTFIMVGAGAWAVVMLVWITRRSTKVSKTNFELLDRMGALLTREENDRQRMTEIIDRQEQLMNRAEDLLERIDGKLSDQRRE
jgi:hypothetical protein